MPKDQKAEALERARKIKLLLFDVDGVLTDGTIWVLQPGGQAPDTPSSSAKTTGDGGSRFE